MTKAELIDQIQKAADLPSKAKTDAVLSATIDAITTCLKEGDSITLTGFGSFKIAHRAARKGCNPRTKEEIQIPASKVVKFTPAKTLKEAVK